MTLMVDPRLTESFDGGFKVKSRTTMAHRRSSPELAADDLRLNLELQWQIRN